jgi:hypothetical protein
MMMEIKILSAEEIWNNIPNDDKDNEADKKKWLNLDDIDELIKTNDATEVYEKLFLLCNKPKGEGE